MHTQFFQIFKRLKVTLWQPLLIILVLGLLVTGKWQTSVALAATLSVNSTTDAVDVNPGDGICADSAGQCTLRAAIMETNALAGRDTISIPAGTYSLSLPGTGEDASAQGDLDITDDLTVQGSGADVTILDGGNLDRIFHLPTVSKVTISRLTIQNGNVATQGEAGGGIFNGLANQPGGDLSLKNVTITNNSAIFGGGIMNGWGASANLIGVTISYNSAGYGGGIYTRDSGNFSLMSSTVSHNTASGGGGGIDTWFNARLSLVHVTVTENSAALGGGILREYNSGPVILTASIIANNNSGNDCNGVFTSNGYNLDSDNTCNLTQPTDLPNLNPLLGPLQDNGGHTFTHALLPGRVSSPAINHIPLVNCIAKVDQRYTARPQGLGCDIGAFEFGGR